MSCHILEEWVFLSLSFSQIRTPILGEIIIITIVIANIQWHTMCWTPKCITQSNAFNSNHSVMSIIIPIFWRRKVQWLRNREVTYQVNGDTRIDLLVGNSVWQKAFGSLNTLVRFPLQALQGWLVKSTAQESIPLATNFLSTESSCSKTDSTAN